MGIFTDQNGKAQSENTSAALRDALTAIGRPHYLKLVWSAPVSQSQIGHFWKSEPYVRLYRYLGKRTKTPQYPHDSYGFIYRTVMLKDGSYAIEVVKPNESPSLMTGFRTEQEAEIWIDTCLRHPAYIRI